MRTFAAVAILAALALPRAAPAASITIDLDFEYSGGTAPQGPTPWLRATFDDAFGGANTVRLTMEALNLVGVESVRFWDFNFDPALDPASLTFTPVDVTASSPTAGGATNSFMADGDGNFDIEFVFPVASFTGGEQVVFDLTYTSPITASSFAFVSAPAGGSGPFTSAAQIQNINGIDVDSGWIAPVPEPTAWLLLAPGLLALRRRRA